MTLNKDFIDRATKITSFNLTASDFTTKTYKKEIQHLFDTHFFGSIEGGLSTPQMCANSVNESVAKMKEFTPEQFNNLYDYRLKGVGPGEAMLYYLVDDSHLGGGSADVDFFVANTAFEIKSVLVSSEGIATDFKLGGTVELHDLITGIVSLSPDDTPRPTEISKSITNKIRLEYPEEFGKIENEYAKRASEYFAEHDVIFINNSKGLRRGYIEKVKRVQADDVLIERVTNGTIKPMIKL